MQFARVILLEAAEQRVEYVTKLYPQMTKADLQRIVQIDPTTEKSYLPWLARQAAEKHVDLIRDSQHMAEVLAEFDRQKRRSLIRGPEANITRFRQFGDLDSFMSQRAGRHASSELIDQAQKTGGVSLLYSEPPYEFWKITSPAASAVCGQGVAWCVKNPEFAKSYLQQGPLIMVLKDGKRLALISEPRGEFKDVHNRPFNGPELEDLQKMAHRLGLQRYHGDLRRMRSPINPATGKEYTADEILQANDSALAYDWCVTHKPTKRLLALAATDARSSLEELTAAAVHRGMEPEELPRSILSRLEKRTNASGIFSRLAQQTGRRFVGSEDVFRGERGPQLLEYLLGVRSGKHDKYQDLEERFLRGADSQQLTRWAQETGERPQWLRERMARDAQAALWYATGVLQGEFPEAEEVIARNPSASSSYAKLLGRRFERGEGTMIAHLGVPGLVAYATGIIDNPWPEAESKILGSKFPQDENVYDYVRLVGRKQGADGLERLRKAIAKGVRDPSRLSGNRRSILQMIERQTPGSKSIGLTQLKRDKWRVAIIGAQDIERLEPDDAKVLRAAMEEATDGKRLYCVFKDEKLLAIGVPVKTQESKEVQERPDEWQYADGHYHSVEWLDAEGRELSDALAREIMPHVTRAGFDMGKVAKIKRQGGGGELTAKDVVESQDASLAYKWAMEQQSPVPSAVLVLAAKNIGAPSTARKHSWGGRQFANPIGLTKHLIQSCRMKPKDIPTSLLGKLKTYLYEHHYEKGEKLASWTAETKMRWPRLEEDLAYEESLKYFQALKRSAPELADEFRGDMLTDDAAKREDLRTLLPRYSRMEVQPPSNVRERAADSTPDIAAYFAKEFIKGPFPEAEELIAKDGPASYHYAELLGKRFKPGEPAILSGNNFYIMHYATKVIGGPWPEAEDRILLMDEWDIADYAKLVRNAEGQKGLDRLRNRFLHMQGEGKVSDEQAQETNKCMERQSIDTRSWRLRQDQ